MILGRGTAQNDEAIITEYREFLTEKQHIRHENVLKRLREGPAVMRHRIGKPLKEWTDEDILALYQNRKKATWHVYNTFLTFLFFRGYRRATLQILDALKTDLSRHWSPFLQPYQQKIEQTQKELDYVSENTSSLLNLLLWTLAVTQKPLEELTREVFDPFRDTYQHWYREQHPLNKGKPNPRLFRLEQFLIHWKVLPPQRRVFRHEQHFASLQHETFRQAILLHMQWCEVKYQPSTIDSTRAALLAFFLWYHLNNSGKEKQNL